MSLSNLLSGILGAVLGSLASFCAVLLDHKLRARSEQKRTLNSILREIGIVRRSLERWIEKRQGGVSWKEGCPAGVRPYLQVAERLPVEVSELPTAVGRQIEAVELKLTIFCAACTEEFERRLTTENPLAHIAENEAGIQRVVRLGEHAVAAIRLAEKTCTEQWDAWQVPFYKRPISLRAEVSNYQGPRRLPGYDND